MLPAAPSVCGRLADAPPGIQKARRAILMLAIGLVTFTTPDGRIDRPLAGAWPPVIAGLCPRRGGVPTDAVAVGAITSRLKVPGA